MYGVCWGWCVNVYQLEIFSAKPITLPPDDADAVHFKFSRVNIDFEHAAGIGIEPGLWCVQQLYSTTLTWYCGEQIAVSQHPQQTIMQHCSTAVCWYRAQSFIICKLSNCIFLSVARAVHHSSTDNQCRDEIWRRLFENNPFSGCFLLLYDEADSKDLFAKQINANYVILNTTMKLIWK